MTERTIHEGRNVKRIREILGMKQGTLALELGLSQQAISALEQKEALDKDMLEKIAGVLKVPVDVIKNYTDETAINVITNTFGDHAVVGNNNPVINADTKLAEALEENKKHISHC
jgi:transcriptional regulator with XRE-family HTH domain